MFVLAAVFALVMFIFLRRSDHAFGFRVGLFFFELFFFLVRFGGSLLGRRKAGSVGFFVGCEAADLRVASGFVDLCFGDMLGDCGGFFFR